MAELSPQAQAVLDALDDQFYELNSQHMAAAVAALRAAANSCEPDWLALTAIHHLHAIADELEGAQ